MKRDEEGGREEGRKRGEKEEGKKDEERKREGRGKKERGREVLPLSIACKRSGRLARGCLLATILS